ncbi:MAG: PspA/IM30 family protein [Gammaproteobacteria bacterium]|nr:PspA/IM30 family protein [Gammaproteobacteria bacterium]
MKESLTGRVGRIISGSLNALVDAVENAVPETVMEEAIREIDGAIDDVRSELGLVVAKKHMANTRLMEENKKHEELTEKIELAVSQSREDLAEAAISQQLDIEAQIPVLETTIGECVSQEKELEGYIKALQAKKREMKEELQQFRASRTEAASIASSKGAAAKASGNVESRVDKASFAFERVVEKAAGVLGGSSPSGRESAVKLAELEDLARKNRIQERLAAIKNKSK